VVEIDIEKIRERCGDWDEETGCDGDFPDTCPFHEECKAKEEGELAAVEVR